MRNRVHRRRRGERAVLRCPVSPWLRSLKSRTSRVVLAMALLAPLPAQAAAVDCPAAWQRLADLRRSWRGGSAPVGSVAIDLFLQPGPGSPSLEVLESALQARGDAPPPAALAGEIDRIMRQSRDRQRLQQMLAALDDDPELARDCLARPLLVQRRARQAYRDDALFHARGRARFAMGLVELGAGTAQGLSAGVPRELGAGSALASGSPTRPGAGASRVGQARADLHVEEVEWLRVEDALPDGPEPPDGPSGTMRERIAAADWPRRLESLGSAGTAAGIGGGAFSPVREIDGRLVAWRALSTAPDRVRLQLVWQPMEGFHEWARQAAAGATAPAAAGVSGAEPVIGVETACVDDTWSATAVEALTPAPREWHSAVWTGAEMIVWGGRNSGVALDSGAAYDPALDAWAALPSLDAPSARFEHTAVWSGSEMIVWGGFGGAFKNDGGAFDPTAGTWTALPAAGSPPSARYRHTALWTGSQMLIWGGYDGDVLGDGAAYDPLAAGWATLPTAGSPPSPRYLHSAVWTGSQMIIWGGFHMNETATGSRLDLAGAAWYALPDSGLEARRDHSAVWTGDSMIVWGGVDNVLYTNGASYTATDDAWTPLPDAGDILSPRHWHTTVWTDYEMIVWGGIGGEQQGGRYHRAAGSWAATSVAAATPEARRDHTAVWAGDRMIVWGGGSATPGGPLLDSGGVYCAGCSLLDWHPDLDGDSYGDAGTATTACAGPAGWLLDGSDCDDGEPAVYPGAPAVCDGLNNDCGHPSWPGLAGTEEFDNDGDGPSFCAGDCVDDDATIWGVPGEARLLQVAGDLRTLSWSEPLDPRADAPLYDLLRSPAGGQWDAGSAACVVSDGAVGRSADDPDDPGPQGIFNYLIRAGTVCGKGPLGADSQGTPRSGRTCP